MQCLKIALTILSELNTDMLWHGASIFKRSERIGLRPNWNGYMHQIASYQSKPQASTITVLTIIDLNPSDMSCIYSVLLFVKDELQKLNASIKAVRVVSSKSHGIVARLGGINYLMSFAGSIGSLMEGSSLENLP